MSGLLQTTDLRDPVAVCAALHAGARANLQAPCRDRSIDRLDGPAQLVATGDLHDNPLHLARLVSAAALESDDSAAWRHLTLHELIHSDRLVNGMDFSYRVLTRVAALKAARPQHIHVLLANHELAQLTGSEVAKDGIRFVEAFDEALDFAFGDEAASVRRAVRDFIRSMPIALRLGCTGGDVLCAHSLPGPERMDRFDDSILDRDLVDEDYLPRTGSVHFMMWGRNQPQEQVDALAERWGVSLFILGHEKAEAGAMALARNAVVLNSDHDRGVYAMIDTREAVMAESVLQAVRPLAAG
ncbi:MAG: metallophosphoesterase [Phycisphaeraceae bacterium]|nr:metallophosphoesterase [Phycisphaeraceae bacterium]